MSIRSIFIAVGLSWAALAAPASATVGVAPSGAILDLAQYTNNGLTPYAYTQYTTSFVASSTNTTVSFIFRDDPTYISFDDASVTLASGGSNLLADPGFESAAPYSSFPQGWTTISQSNVGGVISSGTPTGDADNPYDGAYYWRDGIVGAFDGLAQTVPTVVGDTYTVSFYLAEDGNAPDNNGGGGSDVVSEDVSGGSYVFGASDGIDAAVYAGAGIPAGFAVAPEPSTWALMLTGFALLGGAVRGARSRVRLIAGN